MGVSIAPGGGAGRKWIFVATILLGSFLLFMVQPMIARLALPKVGGAPNVWNSAMLVFQTLLLGGYGYAHVLQRWPVGRQRIVHTVLLALAALTLPLALAQIPPAAPGWEVLWVPLLFLLSVGPVFLLVSAQAPLMQSWYVAGARDEDPYWLYAASNIGSFAGLFAYPLVMEPLLGLRDQSLVWTAGYVALVLLVALCGLLAGGRGGDAAAHRAEPTSPPVPARRFWLWVALAAVPSGLMLSTTNFLTTDIFAVPMIWVLPLGLYLLSFVIAFAAQRGLARIMVMAAPLVLMLGGAWAVWNTTGLGIASIVVASALLFFVATALHTRLHDERPAPDRLTVFYLAMSVGGALGGSLVALIAPVVFNWVWEHPLLILASAALIPLGSDRGLSRVSLLAVMLLIMVAAYGSSLAMSAGMAWIAILVMAPAIAGGLVISGRRGWFVAALAVILFFAGASRILVQAYTADVSRSYFGVYRIADTGDRARILMHGTTLHGVQNLAPGQELTPTTYYTRTSGVGRVLAHAETLVGSKARIGVVGLGTGTLACYARPGQQWTFFEIDRVVAEFSEKGRFTFLERCTPEAAVVLGDARQKLEEMPGRSFDILAVDAFSSDSIPLHLLTEEALRLYAEKVGPQGIVLVHVSNRYFDLPPVVGDMARAASLTGRVLTDRPGKVRHATPSYWIALSRDAAQIERLPAVTGTKDWAPLEETGKAPWTDDRASILSALRWRALLPH
ncbi:fused MFS/spermidine synthase [Croceicoccus sp. BE223]|uniref:spermidine synthase n=1 Tax=Croceicoccus sp. BE223 TaxID=2817716 RepID=UPI0028571850|nr:fused MFS/spermidine synthase [Croceicoccus sp. BE223]MDR7102174.1 hypothetical protein [Croceicoccus sp. BE223]